MSKRQKFVLAAAAILAGIIVSRLGLGYAFQWRFRVGIFAGLSLLVTLWAVRDEDFSGLEWLTIPILPVMFILGAILTYPLLPAGFDQILSFNLTADAGWLLALILKTLFLALAVVGYYAGLLVGNIYNVAAVHSIQLLRVAHSVGFLLTVVTALFLFLVIFSLRLASFFNFVLVFLTAAPLIFQAVWSVSLEEKISPRTKIFSLFLALILAQLSWALSFWPISISLAALFLTAAFYEVVGLAQYYLDGRLNRRLISEFAAVAAVIFLTIMSVTRWGN